MTAKLPFIYPRTERTPMRFPLRACIAATALTLLTACGSQQTTPAPQSPTQTTISTTSTPTPEPSPTISTTTATATTPTAQSAAPADKTNFSGTTALGENVTFEILPTEAQDFLNSAVSGTGLKGSWGALCSPEATANQLSGYTIQTTEDNGQGHPHQWSNIRSSAVKLAPNQLDQTEITNIMEYTAGHVQNTGECMPMQTPLTSAGKQGYSHAEIGQVISNNLRDVTELK